MSWVHTVLEQRALPAARSAALRGGLRAIGSLEGARQPQVATRLPPPAAAKAGHNKECTID